MQPERSWPQEWISLSQVVPYAVDPVAHWDALNWQVFCAVRSPTEQFWKPTPSCGESLRSTAWTSPMPSP